MVCTFGRGRMAAMVRLLTTGSFPEKSSEEAAHEKIAVQTVCRQFEDADEANLLEEKDMHVFDSRPLTDPLHLVCCNACKKPVKASQYAAHAERCRSINSTEDTALDLDRGATPKKPPRKGRKKLQATNGQRWEQEKLQSMDGDNVAGSESNLDHQNGMFCSPSGEAQRTATFVANATIKDARGVHPGGTNCSADVPVPLATKIYHSQGSYRLRTALGHLYRETSAKEHGNDSICIELKQDKTMLSSQAPHLSKSLHGIHKDDVPQTKRGTYSLTAVSNPDQIFAQSSELCLGTSGGLPSATGFSNHFRENGSLRHGLPVATASVGMMKSSYHSASYSYSGNSGTTLGTMQQASGSVPVG